MKIVGTKNTKQTKQMLLSLGIVAPKTVFSNVSREALVEETLRRGQGTLTDTGALSIHTGKFTGRTPKDRFIVKDDLTASVLDWGAVNQPYPAEKYDALRAELVAYFKGKDIFVRDNFVCADPEYRLNVRTITEYPWASLFSDNMFMRPATVTEAENQLADWTILQAPGFECDAAKHGTNRSNFAIMNFKRKEIIIGGTGYTGEIKKGIFAVLNFELPHLHKVLSMHCSANVGQNGDSAVFFGLSGTGKTTLSADPNRQLVGDDEHGWSENGVFNFEGGCYAKTINITEQSEPEIYRAIKHGSILENLMFIVDENGNATRTPDYASKEITENTRVSYPIFHIPNALIPSKTGHPENIFFLTCDGFGVLPPISRLTKGQAMYHFISGYTAKIPGTEDEVSEPTPTFSACFGAPFLPLHPTKYAEMLGELMEKHDVNVWLINTGWSGGEFGVGSRIKLRYTRAMITAALTGALDKVKFVEHDIFGVQMPTTCPDVPAELLNPRMMWANPNEYDAQVNDLAARFVNNFKKFAGKANPEIMKAAPRISVP